MLIDDADRPAKWYFALKASLIESRRRVRQCASNGWAGDVAMEVVKEECKEVKR